MTELYFAEQKIDGITRGYFTEDYGMALNLAGSDKDVTEISMNGDVSLESVIEYFKEEKIGFKKYGTKKIILSIPGVSVLESFLIRKIKP